MKKLFILILLLVVACGRQTEKAEIKLNEIIVIEKDQKKNQKTTKYNEKENEEIVDKKDVATNKHETVEARKELKAEVSFKDKKEVRPNANTSIKKEEPKIEEKQESSPPVALPVEDVESIPKPMPETYLKLNQIHQKRKYLQKKSILVRLAIQAKNLTVGVKQVTSQKHKYRIKIQSTIIIVG